MFSRVGLGIGGLTRGTGGGYDAAASALFARFTTPPADARKTQINTLIAGLKASGVWTKLDALYLMAAADEQAAQRNWIADQYNLTPTLSPTFEADRGYTGDGVAAWLSTGVAANALSKYVQDSAAFIVYNRTESQSDNAMAGVTGSFNIYLSPRTTADQSAFRANSNSTINTASAVAAGFSGFTRRASDSADFLTPSGFSTAANTSAALPAGTVSLLRGNSQYSGRQLAAAYLGQGLEQSEVTAANAVILTYLQAIGAA